MRFIKKSKYDRILSIFTELNAGEVINKAQMAVRFNVNERTIQRDIDDLRAFYGDNTFDIGVGKYIVYDRSAGGYRLTKDTDSTLTNGEILIICKILLESHSLIANEMIPIIDKLISCALTEQSVKRLRELIKAAKFNYVEPSHNKKLINTIWELGRAIREQRIIEVIYHRLRGDMEVLRRLRPVGIMVYDYYFYLTAYIDKLDYYSHCENMDALYPTIYRIDRINNLKVCDERYFIPYKSRFDESEFCKYIQYTHSGEKKSVRFMYSGDCLDLLLDSLPTAIIENASGGIYTINVDYFNNAIKYWYQQGGDDITLID